MSVDSLSSGSPFQGQPSTCSLKALFRGAPTVSHQMPSLISRVLPKPLSLREGGGATLIAGEVARGLVKVDQGWGNFSFCHICLKTFFCLYLCLGRSLLSNALPCLVKSPCPSRCSSSSISLVRWLGTWALFRTSKHWFSPASPPTRRSI